ncbi:MAG: hypothetical protein ACYC9O_00515 [Candidatus Latescibacterota bacterium]
MNWSVIITALLASIGGTGSLIAVILFVGKKWLDTRIAGSIGHEYAKKLEEHKAQLQEQVSRSLQMMQADFQAAVDEKVADKILFAKLMDTLPSSGSIEFIDEYNMAGFAFKWERLDQLKSFLREWDRPENRFLNNEIDVKRECLYNIAREYISYLSLNTFCLDNNIEYSSVPAEWELTNPELFHEVVDKLHRLAGQLVTAHQDLVKTARNKLKC